MKVEPGPRVSTGSISLDCALGGGGLPYGRVVELYGPESSGKTTLALHILANAQRQGNVGAIIDVEHALDPDYAGLIGVDMEGLLFSQPDYGEQALSIVQKLILSKKVKCIVVDSVAALVPKAELDGEMEDITVAAQARLMSKAMRKIVAVANKNGVLVVFINQERDKIGGFSKGKTTPGGKALKFYASVRIEVRRRKTEKEKVKNVKEKRSVANVTYAKVVKSKICSPFNVGKFVITFGKGINKAAEVFLWAKSGKVIKRKGSSFSFGDVKGKGQKGFLKAIRQDKKAKRELLQATRQYIQSQFS